MPWRHTGGVEVYLHAFLTLALNGGEWSASLPSHFTPRERAPGTHWIGSWVDPRASLDVVVRRKIPSPYQDSNPPIIQPIAHSHASQNTEFNIMSEVPLTSQCMSLTVQQHMRALWKVHGNSQQRQEFFFFSTMFRSAWESTQPPIQWVPRALYLGVKWLGCDTDHSSPSTVDVKNVWSYTSTPPYFFMARCSLSTGTLPIP
jgi:hypothetical protein